MHKSFFQRLSHNNLNLWVILFVLIHSSCSQSSENSIIVATAANAQFAVEEIAEEFEKETGIEVDILISSSGKHTAQIQAGAPYDVFISADMKYPNQLHSLGLTHDMPKVYANGKLVIWTLNDLPINSLEDLKTIKTTHIAVPNPKTAPYGRAAIEALEKYDILETLNEKLVFGESVSQANQFILSKSVDVGFSAASVVLSPKMKDKGIWVMVDTAAYSTIKQGVVVISNSSNINSAIKFYDYLFSEVSKKILIRHGYDIITVDE
jgi:molybdate transport system substrate-binding protein